MLTSASRIRLRRALVIRTASVGRALYGATVTTRLKITRAVGRENRAKMAPVKKVTNTSATMVSAVTTRFA